ncbi:doubled CXXCH domain protein, partial [Carboxydothermus islandicus]
MRKRILILGLTVLMIVLFSTSALAAQLLVPGKTVNGVLYKGYYAPTVKKLTVDGVTYYPNEIYLPNEANPAQYRIHSNYSKNTDACAACHATHTAVGGSLLQWGSVYDTCMACHDGTISTTYDVERGVIGTT